MNLSATNNKSNTDSPRRRLPVIWLLAGLVLAACSQPQLNSERIEHRFGSYGVEVLESSASQRVSNLYSMDGQRKICRTLALVVFDDPLDSSIAAEHEQIINGGSIGAVFKANGWIIKKVNLHLGTLDVPANAALLARLMDISLPEELAMHVYRFKLLKAPSTLEYATIVEIHHPAYLSTQSLNHLYKTLPSEPFPDSALAAIEAQVQRTIQQ
jgi:hypothetical protein